MKFSVIVCSHPSQDVHQTEWSHIFVQLKGRPHFTSNLSIQNAKMGDIPIMINYCHNREPSVRPEEHNRNFLSYMGSSKMTNKDWIKMNKLIWVCRNES